MRTGTPTAFSPASVTCFFRPTVGATPATTSSPGCALNLDAGVTAAVGPARAPEMLLNGRPVVIEPAASLIGALAPEPVRVVFETPLPLGCGFGVSAACCLSAALAIAGRYDLGLSRAELGLLAHRAEVEHRTGLGDVAAQLCGGVVLRRCRLGPLDAERLSPAAVPLQYCIFGEIRTSAVLDDPEALRRLREAGDRALRWVEGCKATVTIADLMDRSAAFAAEARLLDEGPVGRTIRGVREAGGHAMMIMLGRSVLATGAPVGPGPWTPCRIDERGTRYL